MMTFDNASLTLQRRPFEERYKTLLETISVANLFNVFYNLYCLIFKLSAPSPIFPYFFFSIVFKSFYYIKIIVLRVQCCDNSHVNEMIEAILDDGGEGVIMRKMGSQYEHGRTTALLKLKVSTKKKNK
jgi:hypothetical protein